MYKKQSMGKHTFNNMQKNHSNKKETTVAEETALKQLLQLNENNDIVDDNNLEENVPTYVVIKDNIPTILKPWSRTPTPSLLIRKSRPSSSLEVSPKLRINISNNMAKKPLKKYLKANKGQKKMRCHNTNKTSKKINIFNNKVYNMERQGKQLRNYVVDKYDSSMPLSLVVKTLV